jgi:15-cis-phytoene synthase
MMALVMGVAPDDADTLARAGDLGIAFQLANIARDVREDADVGRCYLPEEWVREMDGEREALAALTRRLADLADGYEASGRIGARRLPFRSRWAVLAAAGIYGDIAREVARRGEEALDRRVVVSRWKKLLWVVRAFRQAL